MDPETAARLGGVATAARLWREGYDAPAVAAFLLRRFPGLGPAGAYGLASLGAQALAAGERLRLSGRGERLGEADVPATGARPTTYYYHVRVAVQPRGGGETHYRDLTVTSARSLTSRQLMAQARSAFSLFFAGERRSPKRGELPGVFRFDEPNTEIIGVERR